MKKILFCCMTFIASATVHAQKETLDLISYIPPPNWQKQVSENIITYTIINNTTKNWCRIFIVKSTISKGSIEQDFESEWKELVVKNYQPTEAPQPADEQEASGWKIKAGTAKFKFSNSDAIAMLTTMSGFDRCVSIVSATNSQDYLKDITALLSSVVLIKPQTVVQETPAVNDDKNSIVGTWGNSMTYNQQSKDLVVNVMGYGYNAKQYTFNGNNTYYFVSKTFLSSDKKMLLIKENGTYQISGNNITISPEKSILEEWSKKDSLDNLGRPAGVDQWGKLLSTKKRTLEIVTYQFTKHYFSGIQQWNFVLQNEKVTQRDGPHSSNTTFSNAWYYSPMSANNPVIELPGGQKIITADVKKEPVQQSATNNPQQSADNTPIIGTWCISASDQSNYRVKNGVVSTIFRQYTFKANGGYTCNIKTLDPLLNSIFLGRETGTFQISGNNLTVNPQKSVLEEWSKKGGRDEWDKLLKTQNIPIEKITYQFTKQYISENSEWQLILKTNNQTKRDGPFNNYEHTAWIYIFTSPSHPVIKLPN